MSNDMNYKAMGLDDRIVNGLALQGIEAPTRVQELAIPKY